MSTLHDFRSRLQWENPDVWEQEEQDEILRQIPFPELHEVLDIDEINENDLDNRQALLIGVERLYYTRVSDLVRYYGFYINRFDVSDWFVYHVAEQVEKMLPRFAFVHKLDHVVQRAP